MNKRLSVRSSFSTIFLLAFAAWFALSLPIGFFDYLLIKSPYTWFALLQRGIHFGICLVTIYYLMRDKVVLEFNDTDLVIINKRDDQTSIIPLSKIQSISLRPNLVSFNRTVFNFQLVFLDDANLEEDVMFKAQPGKTLGAFIALSKKNNPHFIENNITFY